MSHSSRPFLIISLIISEEITLFPIDDLRPTYTSIDIGDNNYRNNMIARPYFTRLLNISGRTFYEYYIGKFHNLELRGSLRIKVQLLDRCGNNFLPSQIKDIDHGNNGIINFFFQ